MTAKKWLRTFLIILLGLLIGIGGLVVYIDPFFHYHAPLSGWYYELSDQRSQNDGITRHFDYNAIITGTSMTENFLTSQFDALFGTTSVKLPYSGGTFKEINDNLEVAFDTHEDIRIVLRSLDYSHITEEKDEMRLDMGDYPDYLYDDNLFNDVEYLFNWDVAVYYLVPMIAQKIAGMEGGITSFDAYASSAQDTCSAKNALSGRLGFENDLEQEHLTQEDIVRVQENIEQNVIAIAKEHPETTFICFFPPYSAVWWGAMKEEGTLLSQIEAEKIATKMMLEETDNIRVFSFNLNTDLTFDLSNYKDSGHYSADVNALILSWIQEGEGELSLENMDVFFEMEEEVYMNYDYNQLFSQLE